MKALCLMVRKLYAELKFSKWRSRSRAQNLVYPPKDLVTRNTHAKYESPMTYVKKVISKQKVWQTDRQIDGQTDRRRTKWSLILQSHYPYRRSADGRWAKIWKIGRRRPIVGRHRHRFWLIFWSADDFFVEAPKLKVSLTDPPIFCGFAIGGSVGRLSPDDRPTVGRLFGEIYIMISADGRPIIGRQSADDRQTVGRWLVIERTVKEPSADTCRTSAVIRPMIARLSADHKTYFNVILFSMHISTLFIKLNNAFMLFGDSFHWTLCKNINWFLCWISNWTICMTIWN